MRFLYTLRVFLASQNRAKPPPLPSRPLFRLIAPRLVLGSLIPHNLPAQIRKDLVYILPFTSRGFVERDTTPRLRQADGAVLGYGANLVEVGFVADNDEGDLVGLFDADYLVAEVG